MGSDFYISCFFLAIIYLSTVCLIILFVPKWDIYENLFSDNRKWYSLNYILEFLGKCLAKLLYFTLLIGIIYLSSQGVSYYKQPTINKKNLSSGFYNYSDTLMLCATGSISYYTIKHILPLEKTPVFTAVVDIGNIIKQRVKVNVILGSLLFKDWLLTPKDFERTKHKQAHSIRTKKNRQNYPYLCNIKS